MVRYMNPECQVIPEEVRGYLEQEKFTLLDFYAITRIPIADLYNMMVENIVSQRQNGLTDQDLYIFRCWLNSQSSLQLQFSFGKLNSVFSPMTSKQEIFSEKLILRGHEVTEEEKKNVLSFLEQNEIPLYRSVYRNALKRYLENTLVSRYNTFATRYQYEENLIYLDEEEVTPSRRSIKK